MKLVVAIGLGFAVFACSAVVALAMASFIIHLIEESEW